MALAKRLAAARATRSWSARATPGGRPRPPRELGVEGATNADACRGADLVVLATKAEATVATAAELREAIGATPVLSVAAELTFGAGRRASHDARRRRWPRGSRTSSTGRSSRASTRSPRATSARDAPPEEDALVCGDDADAKALVLELAERITSGRAIDCGPLASRAGRSRA